MVLYPSSELAESTTEQTLSDTDADTVFPVHILKALTTKQYVLAVVFNPVIVSIKLPEDIIALS